MLDATSSSKYSSLFGAIDSGYHSMPDATSKIKERDFDSMSFRSIVTSGSRRELPAQERLHLISAFIGDLCQDVGFRRDLDALNRISARLPSLLKTYTLRLEEKENSKTERDAKEYIWQQRE
jgi:hypothetical protein